MRYSEASRSPGPRFSWREVGPYYGVVVVDGAVPYGPAHPPVVAKVGLDRAPESEQEFHAVLLDSPGGTRYGSTLQRKLQGVVAGMGLFEVAGEEVYGGLDIGGVHHLVRGVDVAAGNG